MGWAQPDVVLLLPRGPLVIEYKYTQTGAPELLDLYGPLVEELFGVPPRLIECFRATQTMGVCKSLDEAIETAGPGRIVPLLSL